MMTPVYNVAIADWRTNSCNIFSYAARLGTSVFSTYIPLEKNCFRSIKKRLLSCRFHNVKKHTFQCFHFLTDETTKPLSRLQHQLRKDNFYSSEVKHLTHCNAIISGTEVLWHQAKFALKEKSEGNVLRGYIKDQPADSTTTATDEEK